MGSNLEGIKAHDVYAACELLKSEGKKATVNPVREILGGTGSLGTISKYIKMWRLGVPAGQTVSEEFKKGYQAALIDIVKKAKKLWI